MFSWYKRMVAEAYAANDPNREVSTPAKKFKPEIEREVFSEEFEWELCHKIRDDYYRGLYDTRPTYITIPIKTTGRWKIKKLESGLSFLYIEVFTKEKLPLDYLRGKDAECRVFWLGENSLTVKAKPNVTINECGGGE